MRFDLVIFDCDGVLVDSELLSVRADRDGSSAQRGTKCSTRSPRRFAKRSSTDARPKSCTTSVVRVTTATWIACCNHGASMGTIVTPISARHRRGLDTTYGKDMTVHRLQGVVLRTRRVGGADRQSFGRKERTDCCDGRVISPAWRCHFRTLA